MNSTGVPDFLVGGGELGARIAAHDWAATALGPLPGWPQSLCHTVGLMLRSPVPMVLLWGEIGVMIYNDAYAAFAGARDGRLLGSAVREGWDEVSDFNDNVMRVGLAGGTLSYRDHELTLHRDGQAEQVWMNLDYSPVIGEDGTPAGVLAIVVETSQARRIGAALEQSEARLRFLDDLGSALASSRDADEILAITTRMTAAHLHLSNCAYADMDPDQDGFTIRGDWHAEGSPSIVGHYSLADFGRLAVQELGAGRPLIVNDNLVELAPEEARTFQDIGIAATICMPLVKGGRLSALMAIHDRVPRRWTDYDLAVIREVTERSWAHIQRVGAQSALRAKEAYHRQILDSAVDYGIVATDLDGRITLWNAGAAEMLEWQEPEMLGEPMASFFTPEDRALGRPAAKRREALTNGRAHDARWHLRKSGESFWGLSEMTPLRDAEGRAIGFVKLIRDRTSEYEAQQALRLSEEQLRRAQAAGGIGLFAIDIAKSMIQGTPEFCRIFGLEPRAALPTQAIEQLVVREDSTVISNDERRRAGVAMLDVEYRIHRANDGQERVIARKAEYERDEAGNPVRLVGVVQDVTDRRRTQAALERSEAQFSALAQNMPNQVWTASAQGRFEWFNERVYAYTGVAPGSLDGDRWTGIIHPDDVPVAGERWRHAVRTGETFEVEFRLRAADGSYRWHLARAVPLRDAAGAVTAWVGTSTEIEAQKLAEAAYAEDRNRLWTISQDLMLVCEFDGLITAVNPSAERLLGWTEAEMVGQRVADFLHPDDIDQTARELAGLAEGVTTLRLREPVPRQGRQLSADRLDRGSDNERVHAVGRDITEQRAVEEALRQSQKMEAVGQLTGGIAHDFNNLLQGITGSLDIMEARLAQGPNQRPRAVALRRQGVGQPRGPRSPTRLLAFSRRQPLDPRPVRANPLVASMEDMLRRTLGERVSLELVLAGGLWLTPAATPTSSKARSSTSQSTRATQCRMAGS